MIKKLFPSLFSKSKIREEQPVEDAYIHLFDFYHFDNYFKQYGFSNRLLERYKYYLSIQEMTRSIHKLPTPESRLHFHRFTSFNQNGYVREASLKYLIENFEPDNIFFILVRLNDHVEKIREMAEQFLPSILIEEHRILLLKHIRQIYHLKQQQHIQSQKSYYKIIEFLFSEDNILLNITTLDDQSRTLMARILVDRDYDRQSLAQWLVNDDCFMIRQQVFHYNDILPREKILGLLNDPSSNIRKQAIYWLADHGTIEEQNRYYCEKLMDSSRTVRQLAQFYLKQLNFDFVGFYTNQFNIGNVEIALLALLELNQPQLLEQAKLHLDSSNLKLKRISFLYISHFTERDLYYWALDHLADDISKFQVSLLKYLEDFLNNEIESRLIEVLHNAKLDITKKRILKVLVQSRSLASLEVCLQYTLSDNEIFNRILESLIMQRLRALKSGVYVNDQVLKGTLDIVDKYLQQNQPQDKCEDATFISFLKKL